MKKWGFLLIFALFLAFSSHILPTFQAKVDVQIDEQNDDTAIESTQMIEMTEERIYQGDLLLVNSEHAMQQAGIKSDIVSLFTHRELTTGYQLLNSEIRLSEEIAEKFAKMIAGAQEDGVSNFIINSGYRDLEEQSRIYEEMASDYALPAGYSEHHLGLALDVGSTQKKMEEASEGKWIEENAWKYGFILRYPSDKTDITGIQYEPWHIRYVGLPHSAIMREMNFCLEEYLDYLKEEKSVSVSIDGETYTISYYPISQSGTIEVEVPTDGKYEISGNNMDGVIITTFF